MTAAESKVEYVQIEAGKGLPAIERFAPFKAVLAVEDATDDTRRNEICDWLVGMGARYVMVCGDDCQAWVDALRAANLRQVDIDSMQAEQFVMITAHHGERLRSVFWHAKKHARHTHVDLRHTLAIHLGEQNRSIEYLSLYDKA